MKRKFSLILLAIGMSLLLAACSGGDSSPVPSTEGQISVTMTVLPDPPGVGEVLLSFKVLDAQGRPLSGAQVNVTVDHSDMTGMTMHGTATDQGSGIYAVTTDFTMSGNWKVAIEVETESKDFKEDFTLVIQ